MLFRSTLFVTVFNFPGGRAECCLEVSSEEESSSSGYEEEEDEEDPPGIKDEDQDSYPG